MDQRQSYSDHTDRRNEIFYKFQRICVPIARAVGRGRTENAEAAVKTSTELLDLLQKLRGQLVSLTTDDETVLDVKMADYILFPLGLLLGQMGLYRARVVEDATHCVRLVMQYGWRREATPKRAQEFLILLPSVISGGAGPNGAGERADWPEEAVLEGCRALEMLLRVTGRQSGRPSPLVQASTMPELAHAVTVLLAYVTDSSVTAVKSAALAAIKTLYAESGHGAAQAAFLPGTVSALLRAVPWPAAQTMPRQVVIHVLETIYTVLVSTLGDMETRRLSRTGQEPRRESVTAEAETTKTTETTTTVSVTLPTLDTAWLQATAAQTKIALSKLLQLRNHEADDVRAAVRRFCIGLLDECHTALADCAPMLVESAIVAGEGTAEKEETEEQTAVTFREHSLPRVTLANLAILYPELGEMVRETAYGWADSLARSMQSGDAAMRVQAVRRLHQALAVLDALQGGVAQPDSTLDSTLVTALRDSVTTLVRGATGSNGIATGGGGVVEEDDILEVVEAKDVALVRAETASQTVLLDSQQGTREALLALLAQIGPSAQVRLATTMLEWARDAGGLEQAAALWLSLELARVSAAGAAEMGSLLQLGGGEGEGEGEGEDDLERLVADLLAFSVGRLAAQSSGDVDEGYDWRVGAVAMEATVFAATRAGTAFRPELIDVLYPIATFLGAAQAPLRQQAVTALNRLAAACDYASVSALIVGNVDYMLNAVSLRLNTLDVSPASLRVLAMMVRLAGPRLVPYLDDVVAALFAALDNYHGYARLVESVFAVLGEVVSVGTGGGEAGGGLLEDAQPVDHRKRRSTATTTEDLVELLGQQAKRRKTEEAPMEPPQTGHPQQPWKSEAEELLKEKDSKNEDEDEETHSSDNKSKQLDKQPNPTYALLARITALTQHYLTSPTPTLRRALLALLATVTPALAPDVDAFLPLLHTVWPVVVARLYDGEPYVVAAACTALGALCAGAGDFVASRLKDEWRGRLGRFCVRAKADAVEARAGNRGAGGGRGGKRQTGAAPSMFQIRSPPTSEIVLPLRTADESLVATSLPSTGSTGLGRFAVAAQRWEAVAGLLTDMVTYVRLDDVVLDQILDLLLVPAADADGRPLRPLLPPLLVHRARDALEAINADAVWMVLLCTGQLPATELPREPVLEGVAFAPLRR